MKQISWYQTELGVFTTVYCSIQTILNYNDETAKLVHS